ncbi:hypothetical protein LTR86_005407 [Recurvomyces mirabilis]|nr:hypothetical protein LTR86_005407 [Recurvomyces mirabilis]
MSSASAIGNTGGYSYAQGNKSSVMNSERMPSAEADYARTRTAEIMDALRNGKPGEADKMLGKAPPKYGRKPPKYEEGGAEATSSADASEKVVEDEGGDVLVSNTEGKPEGKSGVSKWFKGKFNVKGKADDSVIR